jgi:hypothetical protein
VETASPSGRSPQLWRVTGSKASKIHGAIYFRRIERKFEAAPGITWMKTKIIPPISFKIAFVFQMENLFAQSNEAKERDPDARRKKTLAVYRDEKGCVKDVRCLSAYGLSHPLELG